ncbi:MAG: hypothetical protein O3A06_03015 [Proteobacteria bacterium]|nr:hypothetical protein [Pseudomonadota bacterium]MDA0982009.1 hypothetical protein [Pseudomonadota bacterium]
MAAIALSVICWDPKQIALYYTGALSTNQLRRPAVTVCHRVGLETMNRALGRLMLALEFRKIAGRSIPLCARFGCET